MHLEKPSIESFKCIWKQTKDQANTYSKFCVWIGEKHESPWEELFHFNFGTFCGISPCYWIVKVHHDFPSSFMNTRSFHHQSALDLFSLTSESWKSLLNISQYYWKSHANAFLRKKKGLKLDLNFKRGKKRKLRIYTEYGAKYIIR